MLNNGYVIALMATSHSRKKDLENLIDGFFHRNAIKLLTLGFIYKIMVRLLVQLHVLQNETKTSMIMGLGSNEI